MYAYSQTGLTNLPRRYHVTINKYCRVQYYYRQKLITSANFVQIAALRVDVQRLTTGKRAAEAQTAELKKQLAAAVTALGDASAPGTESVLPKELPQWPEAISVSVPATVTPSQPELLPSAGIREMPGPATQGGATAPSAQTDPSGSGRYQYDFSTDQKPSVAAPQDVLHSQELSPTDVPATTPRLNGCMAQVMYPPIDTNWISC